MKRPKKYLRDEQFIKKLGERIRELRTQKGLTIQKLADIAGLEYIQLSRIERGKINTSVSHIAKLAQSLETNCSDVFDFE